jgi:hypothetical protein
VYPVVTKKEQALIVRVFCNSTSWYICTLILINN